jgi:hypothetical protein
LIRSLKKNGLVGTWSKGLRHISERVRAATHRRELARGRLDTKGIFTLIYQKRIWSECDTPGSSISGYGSSIDYTVRLREQLAQLLRELGVKTLFDAPCGDFNWMRLVDYPAGVTYLGADIVNDLIAANTARYANAQRRFMVFDIITDPFPSADLWLCRDCLFHLSYRDIHRALSGFVRSGTPYVLTTTYIRNPSPGATTLANRDIVTGDWRVIDLCSEPFGFPAEAEREIIDFVPPELPKKLCLWTRAQVAACLPAIAQFLERSAASRPRRTLTDRQPEAPVSQ